MWIDKNGTTKVKAWNGDIYSIFKCFNHKKDLKLDKMNKEKYGEIKYRKMIAIAKETLQQIKFEKNWITEIIDFNFFNYLYSAIRIEKNEKNGIYVQIGGNSKICILLKQNGKRWNKDEMIKKLMISIMPEAIFESYIIKE